MVFSGASIICKGGSLSAVGYIIVTPKGRKRFIVKLYIISFLNVDLQCIVGDSFALHVPLVHAAKPFG